MDPAEAIKRALAEPLDFPPLAAGMVPGDRVAIAVDDAMPCVAEVVRGAVESLQEAGVEPQAISIVTTDATTDQACRDALAKLESWCRSLSSTIRTTRSICAWSA